MNPRAKQTVVIAGAVLALASPTLAIFLSKWEDGGKTQHIVYADKLAKGLPTACKGITKHTSPVPVIVGEYWSAEKCEEVSRMVTTKTQLRLADCIRVPVSQNTFDAFSSHAHNFGFPSTCASRALELVNRENLAAGCDAIAHAPDGKTPVWSYADGKFYRGLYNRRLDERALCLKPDA